MSITFPDNDNRERRMNELASDTNTNITLGQDYAQTIQVRIKELSEKSQALLTSIESPLARKVTTVEPHKSAWTVADVIAPTVFAKYAYKALSKASAQLFLSNAARGVAQGAEVEIAELGAAGAEVAESEVAAASEELAIPLGAKIVGGLGGLVVAAGIGIAVDAIDGRIARDRMRSKIREIVPIRIATKLNEMKLRTLKEEIMSLIDSIDLVGGMDPTSATIDAFVARHKDKFEAELAALGDPEARAELAALDQQRGSWANEDG